jgi:hypothetical protein
MKAGDRIRVTDRGRQYSSWDGLANRLGATNWSSARYVDDDMEGHIVAIKHDVQGASSQNIALIRVDSGTEHLIGTGGIKVIDDLCEINEAWEGLLNGL